MELTLQAAGSFIKLDPSGITVSGPLAKLNVGGSPGKGTGIAIKPPTTPGAADADKAGNLLDRALGNMPVASEMPIKDYPFSL